MPIGTIANGDSGSSARTKINAGLTIIDALGTISTQAANAVAITGGTISGLTQFGVSMANNTAITGIALGSITDTTSRPFTISQTLNNGSLSGDCLLISITNTASSSGSRPFNVKVGGTSKMSVDTSGNMWSTSIVTNNWYDATGAMGIANVATIKNVAGSLSITNNLGIGSGKDLVLGNAASTGLTAGVLAALTNASIVICDSTGQAYRVPVII